jgi:hypothetical protein
MEVIGLLCKQIKIKMRYLTILFLFAVFTASAQTITFDTLYFQQEEDKLFQITETRFEDGSYSVTKVATTTEDVLRFYSGDIERLGNQLAASARQTVTIPQYVVASIRRQNILNEAIGVRPIIDIQSKYENVFLDTVSTTIWQLTVNKGTPQDVVFGKTATGQLTFKIGEDAIKPAILLGQIMRFNSYPATGQALFLFQLSQNVWQDIDGNYILRKVNPQRR